jgi:RNAse (barnase) inhibitor barstar
MSRPIPLDDILGNPERNGVYRLPDNKPLPGAITVAGTHLTGKPAILKAVAKALAFPDYFGHNWDALEECLTDLSWHEGAVALLIEAAGTPEDKAGEDWGILLDILADSARYWQAEGRPFAVFLQGGHAAYPAVAA